MDEDKENLDDLIDSFGFTKDGNKVEQTVTKNIKAKSIQDRSLTRSWLIVSKMNLQGTIEVS